MRTALRPRTRRRMRHARRRLRQMRRNSTQVSTRRSHLRIKLLGKLRRTRLILGLS